MGHTSKRERSVQREREMAGARIPVICIFFASALVATMVTIVASESASGKMVQYDGNKKTKHTEAVQEKAAPSFEDRKEYDVAVCNNMTISTIGDGEFPVGGDFVQYRSNTVPPLYDRNVDAGIITGVMGLETCIMFPATAKTEYISCTVRWLRVDGLYTIEAMVFQNSSSFLPLCPNFLCAWSIQDGGLYMYSPFNRKYELRQPWTVYL